MSVPRLTEVFLIEGPKSKKTIVWNADSYGPSLEELEMTPEEYAQEFGDGTLHPAKNNPWTGKTSHGFEVGGTDDVVFPPGTDLEEIADDLFYQELEQVGGDLSSSASDHDEITVLDDPRVGGILASPDEDVASDQGLKPRKYKKSQWRQAADDLLYRRIQKKSSPHDYFDDI